MPGNCVRRLYCGMSSNLWKPKSLRLSSPLTREYSLCLQIQAHLSEPDLYNLEYLPSCLSCKCAQRTGLLSHRRYHPQTTAIPESPHEHKSDHLHLLSRQRSSGFCRSSRVVACFRRPLVCNDRTTLCSYW